MIALFECLVKLHSTQKPAHIFTAVTTNRSCGATLHKLTKDRLRVVYLSSNKHLHAELAVRLSHCRSENLFPDNGNTTFTQWKSATIEAIAVKTKVYRDLLQLRRNWKAADGKYRATVTRLFTLD